VARPGTLESVNWTKQPSGRLRARAEALPNWVRALSAVGTWVAAVVARWQFGEPVTGPLTSALFVVVLGFTLFAHWPVFAFDGPLPFSELGLHVSGGRVLPWDDVVAVEPLGDKDLEAVLAGGERRKVRVRGAHTREEFRRLIARYRPGIVRF
jgi:hypothetical protein